MCTTEVFEQGNTDGLEKKKLFVQDKISIHIYALSPTPVKVRYDCAHLGTSLIS